MIKTSLVGWLGNKVTSPNLVKIHNHWKTSIYDFKYQNEIFSSILSIIKYFWFQIFKKLHAYISQYSTWNTIPLPGIWFIKSESHTFLIYVLYKVLFISNFKKNLHACISQYLHEIHFTYRVIHKSKHFPALMSCLLVILNEILEIFDVFKLTSNICTKCEMNWWTW